ncbi:MAG: glycosyltransferase family 2 protein [Anaerolineae bacterium]|nr:glycosyltransferase family 2 protein [Anaerolineae bacterium]
MNSFARTAADNNYTTNFSVVAPVYNEEGNVQALYDRLRPVLTELAGESWEIILVDDGSRDHSWREISRLHDEDPRVIGLRFSRNFGHHLALTAGLDASRGARVVTMDSDLQDQPEELPKLFAKMDEGFDLVYATRTSRQHSAGKQWTSRLFLHLLNTMSDVPHEITGAVFRMMSRRFVDQLCRLRERHRLFTGLTAWLGFKQTTVEVIHGERHAGETKYTLGKMLKLALDSITSFSAKPLYYVMYLGLAISAIAVLFALYTVVRYFFIGYATLGYASVMTAVTFLGGLILMVLGVIGQYVGRIFEEQKGRPLYVLDQALGGESLRYAPGGNGITAHEVTWELFNVLNNELNKEPNQNKPANYSTHTEPDRVLSR